MIARLTTTKTLKANLKNIQTLAFSFEAMSGYFYVFDTKVYSTVTSSYSLLPKPRSVTASIV